MLVSGVGLEREGREEKRKRRREISKFKRKQSNRCKESKTRKSTWDYPLGREPSR